MFCCLSFDVPVVTLEECLLTGEVTPWTGDVTLAGGGATGGGFAVAVVLPRTGVDPPVVEVKDCRRGFRGGGSSYIEAPVDDDGNGALLRSCVPLDTIERSSSRPLLVPKV